MSRPTDLRIPAKSEQHMDYENYCRLIKAVQELLSTRYDGNFFETEQTSGGMVVRGKREGLDKDNFHLTKLDSKSVRIKPGLVWCPFQEKTTTPDSSTPCTNLAFSDETDLDLPDFGQYLTIFARVRIKFDWVVDNRKIVDDITVSAMDSEASGTWSVPQDGDSGFHNGYGSAPAPKYGYYIIPLYCMSAQIGSESESWDNYILVHDLRYAPRFTHDIQGVEDVLRFTPLPTIHPASGNYLAANSDMSANLNTKWY